MSVREIGKLVAAKVGASLKPVGFKQKGAMFLRDGALFGERYAIDGSRWNSGGYPWEFTIDVAVFFPDIPPLKNAKGLWRYAHAVGHTDSLIPDSPSKFLVAPQDIEVVAGQVVEAILASSKRLPELIGPARERALKGLVSPLPVPETWL